ncbi:hypothetical protein [Sphingobium boeckii]|uniref:Uncharacterized protein n=1 Tax=Sphingobium boeckii TaxID=1082345 RepID=A0A7W9AI15_9SPHN|nr:hypothetical protein [Sphingobium boeckii]MBB5685839.1 hypothetical protein [Sphingobium boeckii]
MTKVVLAKIEHNAPDAAKAQTVRDSRGKAHRVRVVDVNSDRFGDDLLSVFRANVSRARKQNRQLPVAAE